jgi:hypothetical protein
VTEPATRKRGSDYRVLCVCCGREGVHAGRGLRGSCRNRIFKLHGEDGLARYPRVYGCAEDYVETWERHARESGPHVTTAMIADRMGITARHLTRLLSAARAAGDTRAIPSPWMRAYRQRRSDHGKAS